MVFKNVIVFVVGLGITDKFVLAGKIVSRAQKYFSKYAFCLAKRKNKSSLHSYIYIGLLLVTHFGFCRK
jgi:hypothetical protein